ncbi:MAG: MBL fold metallo-hydrolase [Chloroflexi bacterium]|nr:MBL fold metallo-hydrolase [Chloroflexota bacterium]
MGAKEHTVSELSLTFLGAAGTVTGSKYLLRFGRATYLIDCGLFQGNDDLEQRDRQPFFIDPRRITAVILSHAHIDHSGYLPKLVKDGFRGKVFASQGTRDLAQIMLPDSGRLQEEQAAYANKLGYSKHRPAVPLYTERDAERALRLIRAVRPNEPTKVGEHISVTMRRAGHILGSSILEFTVELRRRRAAIVFSGDLGRYDRVFMKPPEPVTEADYLVVESTYGHRAHPATSVEEQLAEVVNKVAQRKGVLLMPAFAVGRTQRMLYHLRRLQDSGRIPDIPVYVDSPMASDVSEVYCRHSDEHELSVALLKDPERCPLHAHRLRFVRTVEESKRLNDMPGPMIIIAASGMCEGGRIVHHLKHRLPDPATTVLFVGYQAQGTRGRRLLSGEKTERIHGQFIPVRASIEVINGISAHADWQDTLQWLSNFTAAPRTLFITHGEPEARAGLKQRIAERFGWAAEEPDYKASFSLEI